MKRFLVFVSAFLIAGSMSGQIAREEIKKNIQLSGSNYYAYPGPKGKLSPAPDGYIPFYLSHYGRHGSRFLIGSRDYDRPYFTLVDADSLGKLTSFGQDVMHRVGIIRQDAMGRGGELTRLGAQQHKDIARRMLLNFPEIFEGATNVDAKSTIVIRCILSMENALQQMLIMNPELIVTHDASEHDMYYMNYSDKKLKDLKQSKEVRQINNEFSDIHTHPDRLMNAIFNDESYWREEIDAKNLFRKLFNLAANVQSTDLRDTVTLFDIFTDEEIYDQWLINNVYWYISYGPSKLSGGVQPFSQRNLLRKIISEADSCIALKHPGATLRYGHDTIVMPLTCLLELDGFNKQIEDLEQLDDENWRNYDIFPMACNIQFVFYRNNKNPNDIVFKVLRNENEASLPLKTDMAPYYHWNDFKSYYLKKINDYDRNN